MNTTIHWRHVSIAAVLAALAGILLLIAPGGVAQAAVADDMPLATAAIDTDADPDAPSTPVYAIAEANGRYYVGGNFQTVAGETQPYLAAIDVATGRLDQTWRPQVNGEVLSIAVAPDGSAVYVGGRFFKINDSWPSRIAKLDPVTGEVDDAFDPDADAAVETLVTDGTNVWAGGIFTTIGGVAQPNLAKLDANGVVDTTFAPVVDGNVLDLQLKNTRLYAGGNFTTIDGIEQKRLAALDKTTGVLDAWGATSDFKIYEVSVKPDGTILYAAGAGSLGAGGNSLTAWDTTTGEQLWRRINSGDFQAVVATDELVYIGTHGEYVYIDNNGPFLEDDANPNAVRRNKLAAFDPITGELDAWNPGANSIWGVWELHLGPSGLAVGGDFTTIGGVSQSHFAVFDGPGIGNQSPTPDFTYSCDADACTFDAAASNDPDGSIASYSWDLGDGRTGSGAQLADVSTSTLSNRQVVTLTVTDNAGATARTQNPVIVKNSDRNGLPVELVDSFSTHGQGSLSTPGSALLTSGDYALAIMTVADASTTITPPPGWTLLGSQTSDSLKSEVFGSPSPAATAEEFSTDTPLVKGTLTFSAFRYLDSAAPLQAIAEAEDVLETEHAAPAVTVASAATIVHYWADRSATGDTLAAPGDEATIERQIGIGGGHINSTMSLAILDSAGTAPARIGVGDVHTKSAVGWSIALIEDAFVPTCTATLTADGKVFVEWTDVREARSYTLRRNGAWVTTTEDLGVTSFLDDPGEGTWDYEVRAPIPGGRTDVPCTPSVTVDPPAPFVQTCTAVLNADRTITLNWDSIPGENAYSVRRNGTYLTFVGNTFAHTDTPSEGTWSYIIRSKDNGVTTNTPCGDPIIIDPPPPFVQTCTAVLNADDTITLNWDSIPGENAYSVRRNGTYLTFVGNTFTYTDTPSEGTWSYIIRSKDNAITTNTPCGDPIIIDPPPPVAQTCTATINADGSVSLLWDEIVGEDVYIVRRNDAWLANTGALTYSDAFAQAGDSYVIRSRQGNDTTNTTCV